MKGASSGTDAPRVIRNEARRVVRGGASRRNTRSVHETVLRTDEALATIQAIPRRGVAVLPFRIELDADGVGIEVVKKDLNLKNVLPILLFYRRGAKSHRWPVLCELGLPIEQYPFPSLLGSRHAAL